MDSDDSSTFLDRHLQELLARAASFPPQAAILILGEPSSGKRTVAEVIHRRSACSEGPFETLQFTHRPSPETEQGLLSGRLRAARNGTLLIQEADWVSGAVQERLLPLLRDGSTSNGVRFIFSSGGRPRHLEACARKFPEYWGHVSRHTLSVLPLERRPDLVVPLAERFARSFAVAQDVSFAGFSAEAVEKLRAGEWRANISRLRDAVGAAVRAADPLPVAAGHLELPAPRAAEADPTADPAERRAILEALEKSDGRFAGAARLLGVSRLALHRMLERHGLCDDD